MRETMKDRRVVLDAEFGYPVFSQRRRCMEADFTFTLDVGVMIEIRKELSYEDFLRVVTGKVAERIVANPTMKDMFGREES